MGKGDRYRKVNKEAYDRNWDRMVKAKERDRNDQTIQQSDRTNTVPKH